jgi:hypothetical protein
VLQSLSLLLVGVFASAAVQRYVFGHATAGFVDVTFFVILGALFTATTQTIVPRRDLTTLSGTRVASVLTLVPVATPCSRSPAGRKAGVGRCTPPTTRVRAAPYPSVPSVADAHLVVLLGIAPDDTTPPADSWVQVEGVLSSRELPGRWS